MTKKQLRQEEWFKGSRGLLCFLTPYALHAILTVLYAETLTSQVLALYLVTALLIVWVLLRPGYVTVAVALLLQSLFFAFESLALRIDPATMMLDEDCFTDFGCYLGRPHDEAAYYGIMSFLLWQSSAIFGALVLIGGFTYDWGKRRIKP